MSRSIGRSAKATAIVEASLTYYPKKHEAKVNSVSMLTYREQTLKTKGHGHPMESDKKRFKDLGTSRMELMREMERPESSMQTSKEQRS